MEQGRIENGFYVQGNVKFAVDPANHVKTFDAVAALSKEEKISLAQANGIVVEPFNNDALTTVLKSVVQIAWFAQHPQYSTNLPDVIKGHTKRVSDYEKALGVTVKRKRVDLLGGAGKESTRAVLLYTIDEAKYEADWSKAEGGKNWRGQRYLVIKSMLDLGAKVGSAGRSVRDIFENSKETRETAAPTRNAVGQIINALIEAGIAACLNPQDARQKPAKKGEKQPEAPKKNPPAPPKDNKKKH
jgi:hypothetical protein